MVKRSAKNPGELKVVELFSGAGLFSYAFACENFRILRAVEINPIAAETYRRNLGNHIEVTDVRTIQPAGRCDVLIAGPPCQGFSTLGKRNAQDPRNQLSLEIVRWSKVLRPEVIVIENVPAFLDSSMWRHVTLALDRAGYTIRAEVLDAFDFGVPQIRRRSFTFASRIGVPNPNSVVLRHIQTVKQAWRGLRPEPDGHNHHYAPVPSSLALARMRVIPIGGDKRHILQQAPHLAPRSWRRLDGEATDVWGRLEWDRPSNTLRTCLQNPSKGRYIHPDQHRTISLREAARLHSIPDSWQFHGLPTQIARQIGNSVPPSLGRAVARAVRRLFE